MNTRTRARARRHTATTRTVKENQAIHIPGRVVVCDTAVVVCVFPALHASPLAGKPRGESPPREVYKFTALGRLDSNILMADFLRVPIPRPLQRISVYRDTMAWL